MNLTLERLKEALSYDPVSGEFRWLIDRQRARAGELAGCVCPVHGYRYIGLDYRRHRAGRLAYFYMTGEWPSGLIDHVDRDRLNDKWVNLRQATPTQNAMNRTPATDSGVTGVSWQPDRKRWGAYIKLDGKSINLGRFKSLAEAVAVRRAAEEST